MRHPLADVVDELNRELGMRDRVYTGQIAAGKMTEKLATKRTEILEDVRDHFQRKLDAENAKKPQQGQLFGEATS